jgi:hypothetical protein
VSTQEIDLTAGTHNHPNHLHAERPGSVRQVAVPPDARALSTLSQVDYEDAFVVETRAAQERTGEQWARVILEDAASIVRSALRGAWSALGLQLGPTGSDRFVLGWEVRRSTPAYVLLGASSRIGMPAELLFKRQRGTLLFATFVRHANPIARIVWAGIEQGHRPVVRYLLEQASRRSREMSDTSED